MITIDNLVKTFGRVQAVHGLSLTAPDGCITGLIGPNGAGKSTTFRTVYGVLTPDQGCVRVDGHDTVRERQQAQQRLGVLPDVRGLYPRLSAREHIRYHGRLHGLKGQNLEARIARLVDLLDMGDFADRSSRGLSRGQELKVALARALVHGPANLILDEPTNGLDVVSTRVVRHLLREMRDAGHCILISSHFMSEINALCDQLVVMSHGRLVAAGTPEQLRAQTGRQDLEEVLVALLSAAQPGETLA